MQYQACLDMSQRQQGEGSAAAASAAPGWRSTLIATLALTVFGAGFLSSRTARADEATNAVPATTAVTFAAWMENGERVGDEQVRRLYMSSGTTQLGLVVPSGLRVDLAKADRVTLIAPGMSYFMTLRIGGVPGGGNSVRERALREYPGATVIEESSTEALGARYVMLKLRWKSTTSVDRVVLVSYVPTAAGTLDCSMVAEQAKAAEAEDAFVGALQRLQAGQRGKFQMQVTPSLGYN